MGRIRYLVSKRYPNGNTGDSTQEQSTERPAMSKGRRSRIAKYARRLTMKNKGLSSDTASTPSNQTSTSAMTASTPMEAMTPEAMNVGTANTDATVVTDNSEFESPLRKKRGSGNYTSSLGIM